MPYVFVPDNEVRHDFGRSQKAYDYAYKNKKEEDYKKRSGCRIVMKDKNTPILFGWRKKYKGAFFTFYARPYEKSKITTSKTGKTWINLFVTITNRNTFEVVKTSGLFCFETQRMYLKELNIIANPKANDGGYFGKHISKNYKR